ncbi:glycosyltransferase family 2 protein [Sphingobacterium faecale]|uniref:Glycosyltransferase n=1 Tax=Sphingobacterium faecale TaxID=2803775 RepID=A0ABS1R017_9SPHI|nr:glycosyltransferase [Sphingobacterium faecale]MBL1407805.1 glycosyltransferase [Sphingobacterium faecale]
MIQEHSPLISVVIPCYNSEKTILETVNSVFSQNFEDFEIIMVDDGSIDNTLRLIRQFGDNPKVTIFSQENKGQSSARNTGLKHVRGKYVFFLDSDDLLANNYMEECVNVFENEDDVLMVYSDMQLFERDDYIFKLDDFRIREFLIQNCIPAFCMVKVEHLRKIEGFDERLRNNEDWECWIRMIKTFKGKVVKIPKPLYFYRKRLEENSVSDLSIKNDEVDSVFLYVFNKHYEFYRENGLGIWDFFGNVMHLGAYKSKYYNVWYKRLFYKYFNKSKYLGLSQQTPFFRWK